MADEPLLSSVTRNWLQTACIIAGVGAGTWQFLVKERWNPAAAPINISTELTVKEAGFRAASSGESGEQFEAIELMVALKNPSTRDVYLLTNCWYAQGFAVLTGKESEGWTKGITEQMKTHVPSNQGAHYEVSKTLVVAAGEVFTDYILHPNESISASFVFFVPQDVYDVLRVQVELPTTAVKDSAEVDWTVTPEQACKMDAYRKRNGVRGEKITDFDAAFKDTTLQFQGAASTRELSLWQSKSPPAATTKPPEPKKN
jgi:hypothetical protein